jgi:sigma-B regulation protein RsbU (phosphoserine phosphatase)
LKNLEENQMARLSKQIRPVLVSRSRKLATIMKSAPNNPSFIELQSEVDSALKRIDEDSYGICEVCGKGIDESELRVNPLQRGCVSHLPPDEQRKIYRDQEVAKFLGVASMDDVKGAGLGIEDARTTPPFGTSPWTSTDSNELDGDINRARMVQSVMLPEFHVRHERWEVFYEYIPAGPLGGDYCDLVRKESGEMFLILGDAMGKGIAACMIASRLHALFRTLLDLKLPLTEMLDRANRILCECVLTSGNYATLVCGRATGTGMLEVINAGHLPPLVLRAGGAERILATGLPLGLFFSSTYEVTRIELQPGDTLLFYTDGITEERDTAGNEYGHERLKNIAVEQKNLPPEALVRACREDVASFAAKRVFSDDFTLLALRRVSEGTPTVQ